MIAAITTQPAVKKDDFYTVPGSTVKYHPNFPRAWAANHSPTKKTYYCGPNNCSNCADHCTIGGLFVGYCWNCAADYEGARGKAVFKIDEFNVEERAVLTQEQLEERLPHMKGIKIEDIGNSEDEVYPQQEDQYNEDQYDEMESYCHYNRVNEVVVNFGLERVSAQMALYKKNV